MSSRPRPRAITCSSIAAVCAGGVDVLTPEWLRECVAEGRVVEPRPRHRLHLSRATVDAAEGRVDSLGDEHDVIEPGGSPRARAFGERANAALATRPPASKDVDALAGGLAAAEVYDDDEEGQERAPGETCPPGARSRSSRSRKRRRRHARGAPA